MKNLFRTFVILFLAIASTSCSNNNDFRFDSESLKQTTWEGVNLVTDGDKILRTINIEMQFFDTQNGQYILREDGFGTEVYEFNYSIEGKIMNIEDGPLFSKRTILEFSKDKMVLEALNSYKSTLTLNRRY
ncbi:hypothetical protein H8788_22060 [Parabacteroides faecis]|jgi:lipoprotein|uniref:Lipocalin-like domain-containing protein n=1 Tax=Parabacteroides faecis TaxID=1217282 RepID=A0ABR6KKT3_9BACT|nr:MULTISPECIES: hypothetical protein [Parabacteroides]MBB4622060.1 hypothetical protein [Parabacteroides faecis]MBC8620430.1 hypothetical protein [Parabacteroides faecis]RHR36810.1 hypothetical protein DWX23_19910 [Parabacteroides sp. AF18-52]RHR98620.1 hypothetical protein DWW23_10340 [Parabacteroides sp. AF14-59]GGJ81646.1 hypothetical protein GCM10007084_01840 [Parabacteroides faecis]